MFLDIYQSNTTLLLEAPWNKNASRKNYHCKIMILFEKPENGHILNIYYSNTTVLFEVPLRTMFFLDIYHSNSMISFEVPWQTMFLGHLLYCGLQIYFK